MIKKKYIKPDLYSKKARVVQLIMESLTGTGSDQGADKDETFNARSRDSEWDAVFNQGQSTNMFDY